MSFFAQASTIADASSGVSWGTFWAVISGIIGVLVAALSLIWKHFDAANVRQDAALAQWQAKTEAAVAKVESDGRSARAEQWQEHNQLRDRVTRIEATEAALSAIKLDG